MNNILFAPIRLCQAVGSNFLTLSQSIGAISLFIFRALSGIIRPPIHLKLILYQMKNIGFYSLPVVGITALFTGAVLALQTYVGFSRFSAESSIPTVVILSVTRELGPVITGLMVTGRIGAAIAAEIGTMRVTEQIDALYTLATDPVKYLVTPRIIAGIISLPCLVLISDIIGVMGGYLVSIYKLEFNAAIYLANTIRYLEAQDVISGIVKAGVFGFIITAISSYNGFNCQKGAKGVGESTTRAVVTSSIMILFSNYFITELFFNR